MSMLRRALKLITPPAADAVLTPQVVRDPRARLRHAIDAHAKAMRAQEDADAAVERVEAFVRKAKEADANAAAADKAAAAATLAWATAGAPHGTSPSDRGLLDQAQAAARFAKDAHLMAAGARDGLPVLNAAASEARQAVESAKSEIRWAIGSVLLAEAGPQMATLEQAAAEYNAAAADLRSLHMIVRPIWGPLHEFARFSNPDVAAVITLCLKDNAIAVLDDRQLYKHASRTWVGFATQLATDPEATL